MVFSPIACPFRQSCRDNPLLRSDVKGVLKVHAVQPTRLIFQDGQITRVFKELVEL